MLTWAAARRSGHRELGVNGIGHACVPGELASYALARQRNEVLRSDRFSHDARRYELVY